MIDLLKQIWTIARHSILQALRMKVVLVLLAFLLVLIPALPFLLQADRTHAGQVRMVMTYSIYAISLLLSVLTIFLSAITLNTEIKQQQIFLLDTKPLARLTLLLGKWAGVMLINVLLLAVMLGLTYGCVRYLSQRLPGEPPESYELFKAEVLNARSYATPPMPDLSKEVDDEYKYLKEKNLLPEGKSEAWNRMQIAERLKKGAWVVAPNTQVTWVVSGLPKYNVVAGATTTTTTTTTTSTSTTTTLTMITTKTTAAPRRVAAPVAKEEPPPSAKNNMEWLVIRFRHFGSSGSTDHEIPGRFVVNEAGTENVWIEEGFLVNRPHTFAVPARLAGPDGTIKITYTNMDTSDVSAMFPFGDGVTVMYGATSLGWNFVRAGSLLLMKLTFYAIIGLAFSTFLSFPVAVTASLVVFMVSQMAGFIQTDLISNLFVFGSSMVPPWQPLHPGDTALRWILMSFFSLFPNLGAYDATPFLTDGRIIDFGVILRMFLEVILVRGGIAAVAGWVIFRRRELAALTANT